MTATEFLLAQDRREHERRLDRQRLAHYQALLRDAERVAS